MKRIIFFTCFLFFVGRVYSHNINYEKTLLKNWSIGDQNFKGSFLMYKNGNVFIEKEDFKVLKYPISVLSVSDKKFVIERVNQINLLNFQLGLNKRQNKNITSTKYILVIALLFILIIVIVSIKERSKQRLLVPIFISGLCMFLFSFTNPDTINKAFLPFAPNVNTYWDNTYFYVESKGIATTHPMMVGISNHGWQQQVPIPQCYTGSNAWSIPLNPVAASNPIPVDQTHFTRGAIAIAVNGIPIFNPYTNTGVDAYLDGQLDNFGGHSGRGDDYHYHTAPLHLYDQTTFTLPIAYAFDGYPIFGNLEPDGSSMAALDENHGHTFNGDYHYHGTNSAPYMIAKFAGEVTEDATHQLIPQAQAKPVRTENWTPLNGALITTCIANSSNNGYNLSYTLNGISGYGINYSWIGKTYTFNYMTPTGSTPINYNGFIQCNTPLSLLENTQNNDLVIFPNPVLERIDLKNINSDEEFTLIDMKGNIVFQGKEIEKQDFSSISKGVYFLKTKHFPKTYKLLKL